LSHQALNSLRQDFGVGGPTEIAESQPNAQNLLFQDIEKIRVELVLIF
jgi:hypothetical protein